MNGEFLDRTKIIIAKRAGEKCSICAKSTSKPNSSDLTTFVNLGEAAHINGNKPGKHLRYDELIPDKIKSHISNAIWLCKPCHKEIDSDSIKYTVPVLVEIKLKHENKVYLGEFDIIWQEKLHFEKQIILLEELISEKNKNKNILDSVYNKELNELRISLEKARKEKEYFENSIIKLENTISGLNFKDSSSKNIINAYKEGNIAKVKEALDESILISEEYELARKRFLKGNVLELEKDYINAENNYEKASQLSPSKEFLGHYILYLSKIGKTDKAIKIGVEKLKDYNNNTMTIWMNGAIGELYSSINKNQSALIYFINAKNIIDEEIIINPDYSKLNKAKILAAIATANKNIGKHEEALLYYQDSLNVFWNMSLNEGETYIKELGLLFNGIGLLYIENNNPDEALIYLLKAINCFKDENVRDFVLLSVVYLNIVNVFNHYKKVNFDEARKYIGLAKEIIESNFIKQPLVFLEHYLGVLIKSADNYLMLKQLENAKNEYQHAIGLVEEFAVKHNVFHRTSTALIYSNYAIFLCSSKEKSLAKEFNEKAINILQTLDNSEHDKNFNLTKAYMFRSELTDISIEKKKFILLAYEHVKLCNDMSLAIGFRLLIEKEIKNFT